MEYIISLLVILGLAVCVRLLNFFKTFFFGDKVKRNIINPKDIDLTQIDKDLFYEKMKPYFEQNIVREIYSTDTFCILNVGEIQYMGMPYEFPKKGAPTGIQLGPSVIEKCIKNNAYFFEVLHIAIDNYDNYSDAFATFYDQQMKDWQEFIIKNKQKGISKVDYDFEERIKKMTNKKTK